MEESWLTNPVPPLARICQREVSALHSGGQNETTCGTNDLPQLHCEYRAEPRFALHHAFVSLGGFRQRVSLVDRFLFTLRHEIKRLLVIFRTILLAAHDADALQDQIRQRD